MRQAELRERVGGSTFGACWGRYSEFEMLGQLSADIILINKIMIGFQHFSQFSKELK